MAEDKPDDLLTLREVARYLHCSRIYVTRMLRGEIRGRPALAHFALGYRKRVLRRWLMAWLDSPPAAVLTSDPSQDVSPKTQEREKRMRQKRMQRGSLRVRTRNGKDYWYAQWRKEGGPTSKELGLCSEVSRLSAELRLQEILRPINLGAERPEENTNHTFKSFVESVYLPVFEQKWKPSTAATESHRLRFHLVRAIGDRPMRKICREELQDLLNVTAKRNGESVVDHLRFRLRSIFDLAVSDGVADRNPATCLYTPRYCQPGKERRVLNSQQLAVMANVLHLRERVIFRLATWE